MALNSVTEARVIKPIPAIRAWTDFIMTADLNTAKMNGFLSDHESPERVVRITIEPEVTYIEESRDSLNLNFDFMLENLTDRKLIIKFIKVAIYDESGKLVTYRHVNHNGVGTPSINTIGKYEIEGKEVVDVFNPFHRFPKDLPLHHLRFMFTFSDSISKKEYYFGKIVVTPNRFKQQVSLSLPLKGMLTILDGHDFYSHHRRFSMSLVRQVTNNKFFSNFSRFAIDFSILGKDGNTREMLPEEYSENYDFHFKDARKFYTDDALVYSPADGEIVACVDDLDDLYDTQFDMDGAIHADRVSDIAGNYIVIQHNDLEFSHLFHLKKKGITVRKGDKVKKGQPIGRIGFSGAATTYSHLHYQLMDGPDFLMGNPLPCKFSDVTLILGSETRKYDELELDTGDIILSEKN